MRWFKHMTDASDDEFIAAIESQFGLEGYARWWKLLEAVAKQMKNEGPTASYAWPKWESILGGKRKQLLSYLLATAKLGKTTVEANGNVITITVPKLLELHDEYTRKSGHAPDKSPDTVRNRSRSRRRIEEEKKKNPSDSKKKSARDLVEELVVDDALRTYGRLHGQDADALHPAWLDHFRENGYRTTAGPIRDARASFQKWVRNAARFDKGRSTQKPLPSLPQFVDGKIHD